MAKTPSLTLISDRQVKNKNGNDKPEFDIIGVAESNQKKMHNHIIESEKKYKKLSEASFEAIALHANGKILEVNHAFCKLFGYTEKEVIGMSVLVLAAPQSKDTVIKNITSGFELPYRAYGLKKNGQEFLGEVSSKNLQYNGKIVRVTAIRDLSMLDSSEKSLQDSEEKFKLLVNTIDGIVWECDANTFEFSFVSEKAVQILGYPLEQWYNEKNFWVNKVHPYDQNWAPKFCLNATKKLQDHQFEYRMIKSNGETVWLKDFVTVVTEKKKPVKLRGVMFDITSQKLQEEKLLNSESLFKSMSENAPSIIIKIDNKGTILYINRRDPNSKLEVIGTTVFNYINKKYIKVYKQNINKVFREGKVVQFELEGMGHNGNNRWYSAKIAPIKIDKKIVSAVVIAFDITDSKKTLENLNQNKTLLENIINNNPNMIFVKNINGDVLLANKAFASFHNINTNEVLKFKDSELIKTKEQLMAARDYDKATLKSKKIVFLKAKLFESKISGKKAYLEVLKTIIDKENENILVIANNVTERHNFESSIKESEARYRNLIENAHDLIQSVDMNGKFIFVNSNWLKTLKYTRKDLEKLRFLDIIHPDYHKHCKNIFGKVCKGEVVKNEEVVFISKTEKHVLLEGNITPRIMNKEVVATQGIFRDITFRNQLTNELLTEKNRRLFDIIQTQEEERQRIASDLHDSLGQILTGISLNLENFKTEIEPSKHQKIKSINQTQTLIELAIKETKNISFDLMPPMLQDLGIVPSLRWLCRNVQEQSKIKILLNTSHYTDSKNKKLAIHLYRIVQESLNNAVKYSEADKVSVQLFTSKKSLFLIIEDNGKGFNVKNKQKHSMGITNIKDRVQAFNGKIKMNSAKNQGTELIIEIPLK